jgi:3-oxoadipate enol-lactonase
VCTWVPRSLRPFTKDPAEAEKFLSRFKADTFKETALRTFAGMFSPATPKAAREQLEGLVKGTDPKVAISSMRGMIDPKAWNEDPVKVPALALMAKSPFWTDDYKAFAKKLVPGLEYREFDGVGHFLFMEKPKEVNEALAEFLKKQGVVK